MAYLLHMSKFGMTAHAGGITLACRKDIHDLFHNYVEEAIRLNGATREVMKEKGVFYSATLHGLSKGSRVCDRTEISDRMVWAQTISTCTGNLSFIYDIT
ncbi:DUF3231 family protein [Bacillus megaterium]|nr:DUF3231 family protein [Priestia megaterium]